MKFLLALSLTIELLVLATAFPNRENRIINGRDAQPGEAPYMIQVQVRGQIVGPQHWCGGALITTSQFLSAAHCFTFDEESRFTYVATAGQHNLRVSSGNEQERTVTRFINHPNYDNDAGVFSGFDISVVSVNQPFTLSQWVQPVQLPPRDRMHTGDVQIYGWGATNPNGSGIPDILQTTTKIVLDPALCTEIFLNIFNGRNPMHFTDMCAGPLDGSTDSCGGDSGGPLVHQSGNQVELVALVSWGSSPCATPNYPSVNVRVSAFIDFINESIAALNQ